MPTLYTNELILSFWLRLCRAGIFVVNKINHFSPQSFLRKPLSLSSVKKRAS